MAQEADDAKSTTLQKGEHVAWNNVAKQKARIVYLTDSKGIERRVPFEAVARRLTFLSKSDKYVFYSAKFTDEEISAAESWVASQEEKITWKTLTLDKAKQAIRAYNMDTDCTVTNVDLDQKAKRIFSGGMGSTAEKVLEQIEFAGKNYGGVAGFPSAIKLAPVIAAEIFKDRAAYNEAVMSVAPLLSNVPSRSTIETLFRPFKKPIRTKKGVKSNWLVWATKFWHFLNPDAFPIEDSRVDAFFEVSEADPVRRYLIVCQKFREFALSHHEWLSELRNVDGGDAWSDTKLWDKVYYGLGELS